MLYAASRLWCYGAFSRQRNKCVSKLSAIELMEKTFVKKAELKEKELELKKMELELQQKKLIAEEEERKQKFHAEEEERKQSFQLEMEKRRAMLELLKNKYFEFKKLVGRQRP